MKIDGLGTVAQAGSATTKTRQTLDKDSFMKLFITQMQLQDPLKPMDSHELAAQLAQFSSLEQLFNINGHMSNLMSYQTSQNNLQLLSLMDKEIEVKTENFNLQEGKAADAWYELGEDAVSSIVNIYSDTGQCVRTMDLGPAQTGRHALAWDGRSRTGETLPDGTYAFEVIATNGNRRQISVNTSVIGRVSEATFKNGITILKMDGLEFGVADIVRIMNTTSEATQN
ncbi:MAG: flagellar hook assembly protein FlgD [Pseudomonadota bacterium]